MNFALKLRKEHLRGPNVNKNPIRSATICSKAKEWHVARRLGQVGREGQ